MSVAFTDNVLGTLSSSTPHQASSRHKATDIYYPDIYYWLPCPVALLWHSWREERSSSRQECHRLPCLTRVHWFFMKCTSFSVFYLPLVNFQSSETIIFEKFCPGLLFYFRGWGWGREEDFTYLSLFYPSQKFCLHKHFLILLTPSDKLLSRKNYTDLCFYQ